MTDEKSHYRDVDVRLMHLARQLAEVHLGDHDVLGKLANELLVEIDAKNPAIKDLPSDPEGDFRVIGMEGGMISPETHLDLNQVIETWKSESEYRLKAHKPDSKMESERVSYAVGATLASCARQIEDSLPTQSEKLGPPRGAE